MIDIAEGVREVVEFHLCPGKAAMTEEARLTDLGADSLDLYEVIMSLEEKFDISIDDSDAQRLVTIGDTIAFIESKVSLMERGAPIGHRQQ